MKRQYVATDLKTYINESLSKKGNVINEGCKCSKKKKPTQTTNTTQQVNTKDGVKAVNKVNESLDNKIKKVVDSIKTHKYCVILESSCSDNTKISLMINEGVTSTVANTILSQYKKRADFLEKAIAHKEKINEGVCDNNTDDYDFVDKRKGKMEKGLYDSADDNISATQVENTLDEDGFDDVDVPSDDAVADDNMGVDDMDIENDVDKVGEEIEIKKFVFGVDDVQSAIEELKQMGITASEFTDSDAIGDETLRDDEFSDDDLSLGDDEFSDDDLSLDGDSAMVESEQTKVYEGEIVIDVESWGHEDYDAFNKWLESYGIDSEEIFGGDVEFKAEDDTELVDDIHTGDGETEVMDTESFDDDFDDDFGNNV